MHNEYHIPSNPEEYLQRARISDSFHEKLVFYEMILDDKNSSQDLKDKAQKEKLDAWANASQAELEQWAKEEHDNISVRLIDGGEDFEISLDKTKDTASYFIDACEKQFQARQQLSPHEHHNS